LPQICRIFLADFAVVDRPSSAGIGATLLFLTQRNHIPLGTQLHRRILWVNLFNLVRGLGTTIVPRWKP